jgi:hypothetical protein
MEEKREARQRDRERQREDKRGEGSEGRRERRTSLISRNSPMPVDCFVFMPDTGIATPAP